MRRLLPLPAGIIGITSNQVQRSIGFSRRIERRATTIAFNGISDEDSRHTVPPALQNSVREHRIEGARHLSAMQGGRSPWRGIEAAHKWRFRLLAQAV
jgi:hypothetical protein